MQKVPKFRSRCEAGLRRAEIGLALTGGKGNKNTGAGAGVLSSRIQRASSRLWVSYNMFDLVLRRRERFALLVSLATSVLIAAALRWGDAVPCLAGVSLQQPRSSSSLRTGCSCSPCKGRQPKQAGAAWEADTATTLPERV